MSRHEWVVDHESVWDAPRRQTCTARELLREDPAGRSVASAALKRAPFERAPWLDGELLAALREFDRLAPLAESWCWQGPQGWSVAVRLRRPEPLDRLLGATLLKPWARALPRLLARAPLELAGLGFAGGRMELHLR